MLDERGGADMSRKDLLQKIMGNLDGVGDLTPGIPLLELAGCRQILIENHQGITEYSRERIRICVSYGQLCICGTCLELRQMGKYQLVICGSIDSIHVVRRPAH